MGKTSPLIDLLGNIFRHITDIHSILNNSNELKKVYVKTNFDDADEVDKLIKAAKELIDNLEKKTTKLHTYFNTNYTSCIKDLSTSGCNGNAPANNDSRNVESNKEAPQENANSENEVDSTEPAERNKSSIENGIDTNAPSSSDIVDDNSQTVSNSSKDITADEQPDFTQSKNCTDASKVFLKCVDISKLVNPSILPHLTTPKSASKKGNDPVFIILDSDSEDDASKTSTKRKKNADSKGNAKVKGKKDNLWNNKFETSSNAENSWSQKRSTRNAKKKKVTYVISSSSEVSSLSDIVSDSESDLPKKKRAPRSKQVFHEKQILSSQSDKKFSYKAYVRLERVPCEKLKDNYLKQRERLEVERLANLNSLQKRCRSPTNSTDSGKKTKRNRKEKSKDADASRDSSPVSVVLSDLDSTQADDQALCNAVSELNASTEPDNGKVSDSNPLGIVLDAINSELQPSHKSDEDSDQNKETTQEQGSKEKDGSSGSPEDVIIEENNDKSQEKENQPDVTSETNKENDATQAKEKEKLNAPEGEGNKNDDETTKDKENDSDRTDIENEDKDDEKEKSKDKETSEDESEDKTKKSKEKESDDKSNCDGEKNKKSKKKDTTDDESSCEDNKRKKSKEKEKHSSSEADENSRNDKKKSKEKATDDESDNEDNKKKTKGSSSSDESSETEKTKKSKKPETTDESDDNKKRKKKKMAKRSTSSDDESSDDDKKKKNKKEKRSNSSDDESGSDDGMKKKSKKQSTDDESDERKRKKKKKAKRSSSSDDESSDDDKKKKQKSRHSSDNESESDSKKKKKSEKKGKTSTSSDDGDSDRTKKKKSKDKEKAKWRKDKLLTSKLSETDSEEELEKHKKRREKKKSEAHHKRSKKITIISDSDEKDEEYQASGSSSSSSSSESEKEEEKVKETKKRRRIKRVNDSSDDEDKSTRKTIRKVIGHESLAESTKKAEKEEKERKARILERQKKYNQIFDEPKDATLEKLVLDFDVESKKELLSVNPTIVKKLKPHQGKGVQFMWDTCYESVERAKSTAGSGCILAHCMGLGKTLQVIALTHTLLTNDEITNVKNVLVVCPLNTVLNWDSEYKRWLRDVEGPEINVFEMVSSKNNAREFVVEDWYKEGGVLIIGYDMFRNLTNPTNKRLKKKAREIFQRGLVNPGPDLVVCDEGHLLKNEKTNLSIAMNRIRSVRRIVLTGTPMQNNLKEYYCMVQFVKPNLLGTYKEYINRFVNPITNGQYTDSTPHDINIMRKRSHVLHTMLDGIVQRKDYCVLTPYLPPKHEYVLFLKLTPVQIKLYQHYKSNFSQKPSEGKIKSSFLFKDFQQFQRICTHPRVLLMKSREVQAKDLLTTDEDSEGSLKDFIDDGSEKSSSSSSSESDGEVSDKSTDSKKKNTKKPQKRMTRTSAAAQTIDVEKRSTAPQGWWSQYCSDEDYENIGLSTKLYLLFKIIEECELIGDKLLVFSQSLLSLNIIEYFLAKIDDATQQDKHDTVCGFSGSWSLGQDYFRLDGSTSCDNRQHCCKRFNDKDNLRARLFLISTKAGGLGINLVGANRVVIFDVSWNPSHDTQSIYRVYRFGQTKPCYIYRFVMWGTMETKIYERQVTKQAISKRVIDEQQIDRHYNQTDLAELYTFDPEPNEDIIPLVPKDVLLGELLQKERDRIFKYHEHQSLLENKEDEELNEAERKAAWEEFEHEKTTRVTVNASTLGWIRNLPISSIHVALRSIVQRDNPNWSSDQIMCVVPSIVQQLRTQVDEGKLLLFERVVEEIRTMQVKQQKNFQEYLKRQQQFQQQQQQQQMHVYQQHLRQQMFPQVNTSDVVELID